MPSVKTRPWSRHSRVIAASGKPPETGGHGLGPALLDCSRSKNQGGTNVLKLEGVKCLWLGHPGTQHVNPHNGTARQGQRSGSGAGPPQGHACPQAHTSARVSLEGGITDVWGKAPSCFQKRTINGCRGDRAPDSHCGRLQKQHGTELMPPPPFCRAPCAGHCGKGGTPAA